LYTRVQSFVHLDAVDPGEEAIGRIEAGQVVEGFEEGVLGRVQRIFRVPGHSQCRVVELAAIALGQLVEGLTVALENRLHQLPVPGNLHS
jgi:hypothetical protein